MSGRDQDTDPDTPAVNVPDGVVRGEARPPDEHTMRVRARNQAKTALKVHDAPEAPPDPPAARSSSEMAESSRRQLRRERDRRAEKRAMQMVVIVFLGLGGGAILLVNALVDDPPPSEAPPPTDPSKVAVAPPPPKGVISSGLDETPNIPAIQHLADSGLTIAAEGIPQVDAIEGAAGVGALAAIETCRFSYAVWEFSPNKRFRFLSTCDALEGQVMFGAYEVDGATIRMSPLVSDTDVVVSEFFMVQPSKMVSRVSRSKGGETILQIEQKVTAMRPGLDGEAWRDAFSAKNTIHLPKAGGGSAPPPPPAAPPPPAKKDKSGDPLLDLLKNG